jgi:nitroreductase
MELLDIMNERFSVRKYVDKPVEPEKLDKILNAAHGSLTVEYQEKYLQVL